MSSYFDNLKLDTQNRKKAFFDYINVPLLKNTGPAPDLLTAFVNKKCKRRIMHFRPDARVIRASASGAVDSSLIPR